MTYVNYVSNLLIGEIILDRPKNNPLNLDVLRELADMFQRSQANHDVCVLLKARGENFTVGADLKYISDLLERNAFNEFTEFSKAFQDVTVAMQKHHGVIISVLHGWVLGGGFEISLSADLRYAAENTCIKLPELSISTMFSNATTKLLPEIIGGGRARELMFLGDEISAKRCLDMGLFNDVFPNDELDDMVGMIAQKIAVAIDAHALRRTKELLSMNANVTVSDALANEYKILNEMGSRSEFAEKIHDFMRR